MWEKLQDFAVELTVKPCDVASLSDVQVGGREEEVGGEGSTWGTLIDEEKGWELLADKVT